MLGLRLVVCARRNACDSLKGLGAPPQPSEQLGAGMVVQR